MKSLLSDDFVTRDSFVSFVSFCSRMEPALCTRFFPKQTTSVVKSSEPSSKGTGSWGRACWRTITIDAWCARLELLGVPVRSQQKTPMARS